MKISLKTNADQIVTTPPTKPSATVGNAHTHRGEAGNGCQSQSPPHPQPPPNPQPQPQPHPQPCSTLLHI